MRQEKLEDGTYLDPSLPTESRVRDLIGRMTVAEKIAQLQSVPAYELAEGHDFADSKAAVRLSTGMGGVTRIGGWSGMPPEGNARFANAVQTFLVNHTRLGIPAIVHDECCCGYMARGATIFPQIIGLASTFSPNLVEEMASVIRRQMRAVGTLQGLAPVLDVTRDPRWGRVEETFGEDPYLVSRMGTAYVQGLQGVDLRQGVLATGKHFVGHGMSEGGMNAAPPHLPERELTEVFIAPFEAAIREANLACIMPAIHELDGIAIAGSSKILVQLLRERLGFSGMVVSDYEQIRMLIRRHHVAEDEREAAKLAIEAGIAVELPNTDCYGQPLMDALAAGNVSETRIDQAVSQVLSMKFALGLFEAPYVDAKRVAEVYDVAAQRDLARTLAQRSIVLLKNEGQLLPLSKELATLAVVGPNADSYRAMMGDYSHSAHVEEQLLRNPNASPTLKDTVPTRVVTVLEAIKAKVAPSTKVLFSNGGEVGDSSQADLEEAVTVAAAADVVVLVLGDKSGLTPTCTTGESRDHADLTLPGRQEELARMIAAAGKPVVLVLVGGRPPILTWAAENIRAIVEAWVPGEEGGSAIADVLFGDYNPGGKLPISFPRSVGQIPVYYNHKPTGGASLWWGDYVSEKTAPLFPFGFGLSYTQFEFSNLQISPSQVSAEGSVEISLDVKNAGVRAGDEVVQLYICDRFASVTRPVKELKGFTRVTLQPGLTKNVVFTLEVSSLAFLDTELSTIVEPGIMDVMIGSSSEAIHLKGQFEITGSGKTPVVSKKFFSSETVT